ncbi:Bystin-domain-containing protein [Lactarius indigo]|nr:Bystin-domain-containing protein [Lactarius indigo]
MPRIQKPSAGKSRHDPLHVDIAADDICAKYGNVSKPGKRKKSRHSTHDDEDGGEAILDPKSSKRIFELARDQQDEFDHPDPDEDVIEDSFTRPRNHDLEEADEDDDDEQEQHQGFSGDEERELEIDEVDIRALDALHSSNAGERKTLADLIFSKLENSAGQPTVVRTSHPSGDNETPDPAEGLDPKVVEVYTKYWSPQAAHAATRIFISNMKPQQARVYLEGVVLGLVRADLEQPSTRKDARKAQPALGIVFPLLDGGCTLKEAVIVASVLTKVKVPLLHSSAALIRPRRDGLLRCAPARILLDKKHALPYKVLDALVFHFIRLANTHAQGTLPVLWHQSLLVLCQRYAAHLAPEQKDALRDVVRAHPHPQISAEIRRELAAAPARGESTQQDTMDVS